MENYFFFFPQNDFKSNYIQQYQISNFENYFDFLKKLLRNDFKFISKKAKLTICSKQYVHALSMPTLLNPQPNSDRFTIVQMLQLQKFNQGTINLFLQASVVRVTTRLCLRNLCWNVYDDTAPGMCVLKLYLKWDTILNWKSIQNRKIGDID